MPESVNVDLVQRLIIQLHPKVITFGALEWKQTSPSWRRDSGAELDVDGQGSDLEWIH